MKKLFLLFAFAMCISINANANSYDPSGYISDFWVEHNTYCNGYKGMTFHIEMEVDDYQGGRVQIGVLIMDEYGDPVIAPYNIPASFKTTEGQLCTYGNLYVNYESTSWNNVTLFLPYGCLPCYGDFQCEAQLITSQGEYLDSSWSESFNFSY